MRDWTKISNVSEPKLKSEITPFKSRNEPITVRGIDDYTTKPKVKNWDTIKPIETKSTQPLTTKQRYPGMKVSVAEPYKPDEETSYIGRLSKIAKLGDIQTRLNYEYGNKYSGLKNKVDETTKELDDFMRKNPTLLEQVKDDKEVQNMFEKTFKFSLESAAEMIPQLLRTAQYALPKAVESGAAFAGGAAVLGQAGPQAAIPEELVTVPAAGIAGFAKGFKLGSTEFIYKLEKGSAMQSMIEKGADPKQAQAFSTLVGAINAGLELTQLELAVGGAKKLKNILKTKGARDVIAKGLNSKGAKVFANLVTHVLGETSQEVVQEMVSIGGEKLATKDKKFNKEDLNRLIETAKASAGAFAVLGGLGTAGGVTINKISDYGKLTVDEKKLVESRYVPLRNDVQNLVDSAADKESAALIVNEIESLKTGNEMADAVLQDGIEQLNNKFDVFKEKVQEAGPEVEETPKAARNWDKVVPEAKADKYIKEADAKTIKLSSKDNEFTGEKVDYGKPEAEAPKTDKYNKVLKKEQDRIKNEIADYPKAERSDTEYETFMRSKQNELNEVYNSTKKIKEFDDIKIGDEVKSKVGKGKVISKDNDKLIIKSSDGFESEVTPFDIYDIKKVKVETPKVKTKIETTDEVVDSYSGQTNSIKKAFVDGKEVGTLEYVDYNGKPSISMINVDSEYRRQGVAEQMLSELQKEYPNKEIEWGTMTESGAKLRDSVTKNIQNATVAAKKAELIKTKEQIKEFESLSDDEAAKLSEKEGDEWNSLYDKEIKLENELRNRKEFKKVIKTKASKGENIRKDEKSGKSYYTNESGVEYKVGDKAITRIEELKDIEIDEDTKELTPLDDSNIKKERELAKSQEETYKIKTPERIKLREDIRIALGKLGSFSGKVNGKEIFDGKVKKERKAFIVIGNPSAGKSSVFANPLSKKYAARIIDSDMAKTFFDEFKGGSGAGVVHVESSDVAAEVLKDAVRNGENIVIPKVGKTFDTMEEIVNELKKQGYEIHLKLNTIPKLEAAKRAVVRYYSQLRFVDPDYVLNIVGNKPDRVYEQLKGMVDTYEKYSNDVKIGEKPKFIEYVDNEGLGRGRTYEVREGAEGPKNGAKTTQKIAEIKKNIKKLPYNLQLFAKKELSAIEKIIEKIENNRDVTKSEQARIDKILALSKDAKTLKTELSNMKKVATPKYSEDNIINYAGENYQVKSINFEKEEYELRNLETNEIIKEDFETINNIAKKAKDIKLSMKLDKRTIDNVTKTRGIMKDFPNLKADIVKSANRVLEENGFALEKAADIKNIKKHNVKIRKLLKEKNADVKIADYLHEEMDYDYEQAKEKANEIYKERDTPSFKPFSEELKYSQEVKDIASQLNKTERSVLNSMDRIADGVTRTKIDKMVELMLHDDLVQTDSKYKSKLKEAYTPKYKTSREKKLATTVKKQKVEIKQTKEIGKLEKKEAVAKTKATEQAKRLKEVTDLKQKTKEQKAQAKIKRERKIIENKLMKTLKKLKSKKDMMFPSFEKAANEILSHIDLKAKNLSAKKEISLKKSKEFFENYKETDKTYEMPESLKADIERLEKTQIGNMTDEDVLVLTDLANHIIGLQNTKTDLVYKNRRRKLENINSELTEAINIRNKSSKKTKTSKFETKVKGDLTPNEAKSLLNKINDFKNHIWLDGALAPETQSGRISAYNRETELYKATYEEIDKGQTEAIKANHRLNDKYVSKIIGYNKTLDTDENYVSNFKKNYSKFLKEKNKIETFDLSDGKVDLTRNQMIMLYIHSLVEFNKDAILKSGVVSPSMVEKFENGAEDKRTNLTEEDIDKITSTLTISEKRIATYWFELSKDMGNMINEVSVQDVFYNIVKKDDGKYAPTNRSSAYRHRNLDGAGKTNLGNLPFLKPKTGGTKPVVLENFTDMMERQIDLGTKYYGLRLPTKALKKLIENPTFSNKITKTFGQQTLDSFVDLYDKMNGVRAAANNKTEKIAKSIISNSYQAILGLNPKIIMYQPISLLMASPEFSKADLSKGVINKSVRKNTMYKHSDLIRLRAEGYINKEVGELQKLGKGAWQTKGIQKADMLAISKIWNASENFIKRTKPTLKVGSDAYYQAVAAKTENVIKRTQPNYTNMQRSQILRSDSIIERLFTAFSTQRNQNYNRLFESIDEANVKGTRKSIIKRNQTITALAVSSMLIAVIKSMYSMYRGREPEVLEKFINASAGTFYGIDAITNVFTSGYDYDNIAESTINQFLFAVGEASAEASGVKTSSKTAIGHVNAIVSAAAQMSGYSVANAEREVVNFSKRALPELSYTIGKIFKTPTRTNMYNLLKDSDDKNLQKKIIKDLQKSKTMKFGNIEQSIKRDGDMTDKEKVIKIRELKKIY